MQKSLLFDEFTKIPDVDEFLQRPRLNKLRPELSKAPVTLVVAGAGFGKTQLVSSLIQPHRDMTFWIQLSRLDNLTQRFWDHLVHSMSSVSKDIAEKLNLLGFPSTIAAFDHFLRTITKNADIKKTYYIVFDDLHLIDNPEILQTINNLIEARIQNLKIIIMSRNTPNLDLSNFYAKEKTLSISEDTLRFTKEEIKDYFKMQSIDLSDNMLDDIYNMTDGWILAIYMLGLSIKGGAKSLSFYKKDVFKLIEDYLFLPLSKELQGFLIVLSMFDTLHKGLVTELAADRPELINEMEHIGAFVRYDAGQETYRLHHLFLEYLSKHQSDIDENLRIKNNYKAAVWFEKNGFPLDAITHYNYSKRYSEVIRLLSFFSSRCSISTANMALDLINGIPDGFIAGHPMTRVLKARFLSNNYLVEQAFGELTNVIADLENKPRSVEDDNVLGEAYLLLGFLNMVISMETRNYGYARYFQMADQLLPNGSIIFGNNLRLNADTYASIVKYPDKKDFEAFKKATFEVMPHLINVTKGCGAGNEQLVLTEEAYFKRNFKGVRQYAYQAMFKAQQNEQFDIENMAKFYLIRFNLAQGHYYKIKELTGQLKGASEIRSTSELYAAREIIEGWFFSMIGKTENVAKWIKGTSGWKSDSPITFSLDRLVRARCYLAEKKYEELIAFIDNKDYYSLENYLFGSIELKIIKSIAQYKLGDKKHAVNTFVSAYDLAAPNMFVMPFIENGKDVRTITNAIIKDNSGNIPRDWLEDINIKASTYAKKLSGVISEYEIENGLNDNQLSGLSQRELSILTDLCYGLSRKEIADNCGLSENTVKTIMVSIFNKLGVSDSISAVRVAVASGLLNSGEGNSW